MDKNIEEKIRGLVGKFHLLRTKEGSAEFDILWKEVKASIPEESRKEAGQILRDEMTKARQKMKRTDIDVRSQIGDLNEVLSLSYIAKRYFHKDRSWLAQWVNGNIVNGKPCAFTQEELDTLKFALGDIKNKLSETILNIK